MRFYGSCRQCGMTSSHLPHKIGEYKTTQDGWLDYFCAGVEPGFIVTKFSTGFPIQPSLFEFTVL